MTIETLTERQIALESEAVGLGAERYRKARPLPWRGDEQPSVEEEANLPPGRQLMKLIVGRLSDHISDVLAASAKGQAGRTSRAIPMLNLMQPEQVSYIITRYAVNSCTRHLSVSNLARQIAEALRDHLNYEMIKRDEPAFFQSLMKANKKAGNYGKTWRTKIRRAMKSVEQLLIRWSVQDTIQIGTKCVEMLVDAVPDLFSIERDPNPKTGRKELILRPTAKLRASTHSL